MKDRQPKIPPELAGISHIAETSQANMPTLTDDVRREVKRLIRLVDDKEAGGRATNDHTPQKAIRRIYDTPKEMLRPELSDIALNQSVQIDSTNGDDGVPDIPGQPEH